MEHSNLSNLKPAAVVVVRNNIDFTYLGIICKKGRGIICPGGRLEKGEGIKEAAVRELKEETGGIVSPNKIKFVFGAPDFGGYFVHAFLADHYNLSGTLMETNEGIPAWFPKEEFFRSSFGIFYECLFDVIEQ